MRKLGEDQKIDFVIAWVDGNDPEWRREKSVTETGIICITGFVVLRNLHHG